MDQVTGEEGSSVPFLRYLPEHLGLLGSRVEVCLEEALGQQPSFVVFAGYDTRPAPAHFLAAPPTAGQGWASGGHG